MAFPLNIFHYDLLISRRMSFRNLSRVLKKKRNTSSTTIAIAVENFDGAVPTFEDRLAVLPDNYREHILRQYELSDKTYTMFDIRWASPLEIALMSLGTVMAVGAGLILLRRSNRRLGAAAAHRRNG